MKILYDTSSNKKHSLDELSNGKEQLYIGRSSKNDVVLGSDCYGEDMLKIMTISRTHALLNTIGEGFLITNISY